MTTLGWILVGLGVAGFLRGNVGFVRETLPNHYWRNPGFGAYEVQVLPGWAALSVGAGLITASTGVGVSVFLLGLVGLGFLGQVVSKVFGR